MLANDSAGQRGDAQRRTADAGDRVAVLTAHLADAGIDADVAQAPTLAA